MKCIAHLQLIEISKIVSPGALTTWTYVIRVIDVNAGLKRKKTNKH